MNFDDKEYYKEFNNTLIVRKNYYFFIFISLLFSLFVLSIVINQITEQDNFKITNIDNIYSTKFNKPELIYLNDNYYSFKNNNPINHFLNTKQLQLYWSLCIDVCEHPELNLISKINNSKLHQYICNSYIDNNDIKKLNIKWTITNNGCEISNKKESINYYHNKLSILKLNIIKLEFILIISIMILLTLINLQLKKR